MNYLYRPDDPGLEKSRAGSARIMLGSLAFLSLIALCVGGIRLVSNHKHSAQEHKPAVIAATSNSADLAESRIVPQIQSRSPRVIYPYSIVPGGIKSADELRQAATHDSVVANHYAGFNYRRAHLIEVKQAQRVYLSYRLHNKVYWTIRQASLHPGEKLLTDGALTARARCGNQVSVLPRAATSPDEPPVAELDRPDALASGFRGLPPLPDSPSLVLDPGLPVDPSHSGPTGMPGGGGPPGVYVPPPVGGGGGGPGGGGGSGGGGNGGGGGGGGVGGGGGGGGHPPEAPEPGTIVLVLSGAGVMFARYRKR